MGLFDNVLTEKEKSDGGFFSAANAYRARTKIFARPLGLLSSTAHNVLGKRRGAAAVQKKKKKKNKNKNKNKNKKNKSSVAVALCDHDSSDGEDFAVLSGSLSRAPSLKISPQCQPVNDPLSCTIFVGNLSLATKPKQLRTIFANFGSIASVRLRSVPVATEGKMPRAGKVVSGKLNLERKSTNAYVVFKNETSAAAATEVNMQEIDGRHIRVDRAKPPSSYSQSASKKCKFCGESTYDYTRSLFLGNLPYAIDEEDIIRFIHENKEYPELLNSIAAVRVVRDRNTSLGKGFAFVLLRRTADVRVGLLLDRAKIGEREIRVMRASKCERTPFPNRKQTAKVSPELLSGSRASRVTVEDPFHAQTWEGLRSQPGGKRRTGKFTDSSDIRCGPRSAKLGIKMPRGSKRHAVAARKARIKARTRVNTGN